MNEHDNNNLAPRQAEPYDLEDWAIPTGAPEEFGFPAKPNAAQTRAWTNQQLWLEAFTKIGSVGAACAEVGISVSTAERWSSVDLYGFKKRKADAAQLFLGKVEAEINRRAIEGVDHPVIYKGEITTTYKEFSDNLLMFRAKRLDPSYRDNYVGPNKDQQIAVTRIIINLAPGVVPPDQPQVIEMPSPSVEGEYREISEGKRKLGEDTP